MADIRITPAASVMAFTSSLAFKETFTQSASGSITLYGSGSTGRTNLFAVDGNNGRLFSIDDDLSNSLFSVNTIAGLPVIEAFADNTVNIGKYGAYSFQALGNGNAGIGSGSVMFVSASGVVGIGTTNPGYKLDVNGITNVGALLSTGTTTVSIPIDTGGAKAYLNADSISGPALTLVADSVGRTLRLASNTSGTVIGVIDANSAGLLIGTNTNYPITFNPNATERMRITSAGNVGIGTTNPTYKFESHNNATANAALLYSSTSATTVAIGSTNNSNNANVIWYTDSGNGQIFRGGTGFSAWAGALSLNIYNSNGPIAFHPGATANVLYLATSSKVGIGTTSPGSRLQVGNAGAAPTGLATLTLTGANTAPEIATKPGLYHRDNVGLGVFSDYAMSFQVNGASSLADAMFITNTGNVGIGTTTPSEKLTVAGAITSTSIIYTSAGSLLARASGTEGAQYQLNGITVGYSTTGTYGWLTAGGAAARTSLALNAGGGNVGIGTTNPSFNLDIAGSARAFVGAGTTNYNYFQVAEIGFNLYGRFHYIPSGFSTAGLTLANSVLINAADGATAGLVIRTDADAPIIFGTNQTSEKMRITGAGNVGIGTTSPNTKLHVYGGSANSEVRITSEDGYKTRFGMYEDGAGSTWGAWVQYNGATDNLEFGHKRSGTDSSPEMIINISGQVGIGVTNPSGKLQIYGADTIVNLTNTNAGGYGEFWFTEGAALKAEMFVVGSSLSTYAGANSFIIYQNSNAPIAFYTNGTNERMRITGAGNVGIGTTNPATKLDVVGTNVRTDKAFISQGSNLSWTGGACFIDYTSASSYGRLGAYNYATAEWENLYIGGGGKIGIGTTTFTYRVNILGDMYITGGSIGVGVAPNATDGRIDASNDIVAYSTSDIRFKENIQRIPNALEKVNTLSGNTFTWKSDPELTKLHGFEGNDVGIIAQEIEAILPDIVTTRDSGYKAVKYEKLVPLLIEAIKELTDKVNKLENR